jgi:hypothetical protein
MNEPVLETSIWGMLIGTLIRLSPEFVKLLHKWLDNKHEKDMLVLSNAISENEYKDRYIQSTIQFDNDYVELISKAQQKKTGILYVDIIRALVRPYATYILLALYVGMKIAYIILNPTAPFNEVYTSDDIGILSGVLSFWFLGRVLEKK